MATSPIKLTIIYLHELRRIQWREEKTMRLFILTGFIYPGSLLMLLEISLQAVKIILLPSEDKRWS